MIMARNRKVSKIGTVAAILGSVILSGSTVFAYAPMQTMRTEVNDSISSVESVNLKFYQTANNTWTDSQIHLNFSDNSTQLVESDSSETRAILCTHVYESCYAETHTSKSNGGCVVKTYRAKRCKKCNDIVLLELVNTNTFTTCIHK